jgi:hypothetical protein
MESNGPEAKVRGPASHIHERYLQLARDAASSGDRVLSENYLQHADHYFRLWRQMQPAAPPPQPERFSAESEYEGDEEGAPEAEAGEEGEAAAAEGGDQPDVEFPQGDQPRFERGEGEGRRRRGRRNRFRPGGGEGGEGGEGEERRAEGEPRRDRGEGEGRRDRSEGEGRDGRRERQPRERDGEQAGPEGFSTGPRPAFLRGGD